MRQMRKKPVTDHMEIPTARALGEFNGGRTEAAAGQLSRISQASSTSAAINHDIRLYLYAILIFILDIN
ncbi:hypothetical protein EB796_011873 [Bugula neritina]|uniref:Uncharacterized protein n=1 Tax=Bugula neritina TaxID=10212 RepID=A0A7J7JVE2_BUGNE|nr:hypothetical protein EB796_023166 [Bugula neritina]KAF6029835.1 hypothetical protein EB796_011873 [Bugula neritina]